MDALTKILNAASELFRQYGFKTITMDDVARRAGISKKTLYQHFANKSVLVSTSVEWYKDHLSEACTNAMQESDNAVEGMVRTAVLFDQVIQQLNPLSMLELERYFPDSFLLFKKSLQTKDVLSIAENLQRGIEEGLYRPDINIAFLSQYRMEISLMVFYPSLLVENRTNIQQVAQAISEHFLYGIMTTKGVRLYTKYKDKYFKEATRI
ncbi:MAG: TetR/AcrR family transcriptional regulator [Bacteroidetes bacterium]|nr:TetR/AcrR family transcriptional regulator [Bacteroidota bacterium]